MTRFPFARCALAASLVAAFAAAGVHYAPGASAAAVATGPSPAAIVVRAAPGMAGMPGAATAQPAFAPSARGSVDFSDIVERYGPAVVNVSVTGRAPRGAPRGGPGAEPEPDDALREFLRRFGPPGTQQAPRGEVPAVRGLGSGFIVSADGLILTNAHVVEGAEEIVVRLTDRREFRAKLVGADPQTDVAVLRIEARNLPTVKLGDPSRVKVGEPVLAIGSPYGFENTVTAGIVSAKSRSLPDDTYVPFLQTDVAVNPGNSGGPLFDARGEVIGINSQIYSRTGGFMGISFAIPIDEANRVADQLRTQGRVTRGRIGVAIAEVTKDVADALGLARASGALLRSIEVGGPADKAGLEPGDIMLRFDGKAIEKSSDLPRIVGNTKPGAKVSAQLWRKGAVRDVSLVVGEMEPDRTARATPKGGPSQAPTPANWLGLSVSDLTDARRAELKIKGGVLVDSADGHAARAGIRQGDVLISINNADISSTRQFTDLVVKLDQSKGLVILVRRGDGALFIPVRPTKAR
jgi:serine protease Do